MIKPPCNRQRFPLNIIGFFDMNADSIGFSEEYTVATLNYIQDQGTFIDGRDNTEYKWVKIKNKTWMVEEFVNYYFISINL
jgi:hypothetical protein